jgi:hypothetical protein
MAVYSDATDRPSVFIARSHVHLTDRATEGMPQLVWVAVLLGREKRVTTSCPTG